MPTPLGAAGAGLNGYRLPPSLPFPLQPVAVPLEHVTSIDVREALLSVAPSLLDQSGSFGSVVYRFSGMSEGNIFGATLV